MTTPCQSPWARAAGSAASVSKGIIVFKPDHIEVLARFKRGELYDSRKVDDLRKALVATNLFATVAVEPKDSGEAAPDGTEYVTMNVRQKKGPPRTIAGQLGYAAGQGASAEATWTNRNMFPPEGALIAHVLAGTVEQGAGLTFRRSNAGQRDRTFEMVAEAYHNNYDAYSAYTGRLAAKVSRDSTQIWQKKITYSYGAEVLATAETDYDPATQTRDRHLFYVAGVTGQIGYDTSDSLLNPTKGYRVTLFAEPETTLRHGFSPYLRTQFDASAYYPLGQSFVLAGRVRFATIQGAGLYDIAPSRRFYAGGGGSVRGYAYQSLGEQAADGKAVGGRSLNEGSVEARYRFGNYGVVAFVDAGQAYSQTSPQFSDLRYGVGIGGRFYTNFGPFRLDVATPIARRKGEVADQRLCLDRAGILMADNETPDAPALQEALPQETVTETVVDRRSVWQRVRVRLAKTVAAVILGVIALAALVIFGIDTGPGHRFVADQIGALKFENGMRITVGRIEGSLYGKMTLHDLSVRDPKGEFLFSPEVKVDWRPI